MLKWLTKFRMHILRYTGFSFFSLQTCEVYSVTLCRNLFFILENILISRQTLEMFINSEMGGKQALMVPSILEEPTLIPLSNYVIRHLPFVVFLITLI